MTSWVSERLRNVKDGRRRREGGTPRKGRAEGQREERQRLQGNEGDNSRPLVVVESDDLGGRRVEHDGSSRIDDAALLPSQKVGGDELVVVHSNDLIKGTDCVAALASSGLAKGEEQVGLGSDGGLERNGEVYHGYVVDGNTNRDACKEGEISWCTLERRGTLTSEFSGKFRQNELHGRGSARSSWDDV